jgi:C4-type Zn-finger protein
MKLNNPTTTPKCCPECNTNYRVKNTVNMNNEVVKVWTCNNCYFRETKVNLTATKRWRIENDKN